MHQHDEHLHHDDEHAHRDPDLTEEPLDAANQSLSDALRASFRILKVIMIVLLVLYMFSNVRGIGSHEQALVLRMGRLIPTVHEAGLVKALPFPIDEILRFPTRQSNDLWVESHTFWRKEEDIGKPISALTSLTISGLDPSRDGALLTADAGLVHIRWKITFKISDVRSYVTQILGEKVEAAERLLQTAVETEGIRLATELSAEEMVRTRVDYVQEEMRRRLNLRLTTWESGIEVTLVEVHDPTPPLPVRTAFEDTQKAENSKQRRIQIAEEQRNKILNEAAGAAHARFVDVLDRIAEGGTADQPLDALLAERDRMLGEEVEGKAGEMIKDASAYHAVAVGQIQSDLELYRTLLPEYERSPELLLNRLWEKTREQIFNAPGVVKLFRPSNLLQFRLKVPLDPEQSRQEEAKRTQEKEFDIRKIRPEKWVPLGPNEGG